MAFNGRYSITTMQGRVPLRVDHWTGRVWNGYGGWHLIPINQTGRGSRWPGLAR
jgi:hypothetical protein